MAPSLPHPCPTLHSHSLTHMLSLSLSRSLSLLPCCQVHYSIGKCGTYLLHIGLRQQSTPLPGSPFVLEVSPGPAHALATRIEEDILPLRGRVVTSKDKASEGCVLLLRACDKMGNACTKGGATVRCGCRDVNVDSSCEDLGDGTYSEP